MARAAILLASAALLAVAANVVLGAATGFGRLGVLAHATAALATSVMALFAWSFVVLYLVHALAWIKEQVAERRLDPAAERDARAVRGAVLPWIVASVLALIAAYVVGGGADTGAVHPGVHLALALLALLLHVVTVYRTILGVGIVTDLESRFTAEGER